VGPAQELLVLPLQAPLLQDSVEGFLSSLNKLVVSLIPKYFLYRLLGVLERLKKRQKPMVSRC